MCNLIRIGFLSAAALFGGLSIAEAHPDFIPGSCHPLNRSKARFAVTLDNAEEMDFVAPLLRFGDTTAICRTDIGPGVAITFTGASTGFNCDLGAEEHPVAKTKNWVETIKPNGEVTLICTFGPR
jgi:hypothetical protein